MNRFLKWVLWGAGGLVGLVFAFVAVVFVFSEITLSKSFTPEARALAVPTDAASIAEGGRLARVRGCYDGCHGEGGVGSDFFGIAAPNLTRLVREYSDAELEAVIRQGIRPNGTSVVAIMSSEAFQYLSDDNLGDIIAFFRSLPESPNDPGPRSFGFQVRAFLMFLTLYEGVEIMAAERIAAADLTLPDDRSDPVVFGRYLAMSICVECHGPDLYGDSFGGTPDLIVASAYSGEEFRHLMTTGETADGRDLGLMAEMARRRFSHLHAEEIDAIYAYLTSDEFLMAERE